MYERQPGTCLGCGFDPWIGHVQEATDRCFSLTLMFLSFPSPLKIIKSLKKRVIDPKVQPKTIKLLGKNEKSLSPWVRQRYIEYTKKRKKLMHEKEWIGFHKNYKCLLFERKRKDRL